MIGTPAESSLHQRRSSSKNNLPMSKGLRHIAKSAFTRTSTSVSATDIESLPVHVRTSSGELNQHSRHPNSTSSSVGRPGSKAERFFGLPLTAHIVGSPVDSQSPSSVNTLSPAISFDAASHKSGGSPGIKNAGFLHTRSTTNSSEGYSTFDDSSALTTPMQSISDLHNDLNAKSQRNDHVYSHVEDSELSHQAAFMMTNALPVNTPKVPSTPHPGSKAPTSELPVVPALPNLLQKPESLSPTGDSVGVGRQRSITRSVSTPELPQQDLSFLPALKHQPLTKPSKVLKTDESYIVAHPTVPEHSSTSKSSIRPQSMAVPVNGSLQKTPISSNHLQNARLSMPRPVRTAPSVPMNGADTIAKMFVICCSCKYFHDMPSKIYECMARSDNVVEDKDLGVSGVVSTSVRCPWCAHGMTTACCAGYAAVVLLREKLH